MKSKLNYKSRRVLILVVAIIVALGMASLGTYFYIKGNNETKAANKENQNSTVSTVEQGAQSSTENDSQNEENQENANQDNGQQAVNNSGADTTNVNNNNNNGNAENNGNVNNGGNAGNNNNGNAGTTTAIVNNQNTDATVAVDYEEVERVTAENSEYAWTPEGINVQPAITDNFGTNKYKLNIEKTVLNPKDEYDLGDKINYQVVVTNNGNVTISGINLSDKINDKEVINNASRVNEKNELIENVNLESYTFELVADQTAYFTYEYEVKEVDLLNKKDIENRVIVKSNKAEDDDTVKVTPADVDAEIELTKNAVLDKVNKDENYKFNGKAEVGDTIHYEIKVTNKGNVTLKDIEVKDVTMDKNSIVSKLLPSQTLTAIQFDHVVEANDIKEVNGEFFVNNVASVKCSNPSDPENDIEDETESNLDARDLYDYTVKYVEEGTNNIINPVKFVKDQKLGSSVTENAVEVKGYNPVITTATINITTGNNEYTFYYTKKNNLSYTVNYYEEGTTTSVAPSKTEGNKTYKESIKENAIEVRGYNAVAPTEQTIEIDDGENVINFYYTKKTDLSYTVHYYQEGTTTKVTEDTVVTGYTFGESVTVNPKDVDNYEVIDSTPITFEIKDDSNEYIFYYAKYLEISKTTNNNNVNVGDILTYNITITNPNRNSKQTTVTDVLPEGIMILDSEDNEITNGILPDGKGVLTYDGESRKIIWENIELPEGDTVLTLKTRVKDNMIGKEIINSANLSNLGQHESNVTTRINEIEIDKTEVKPGETDKDAANIVLVMDLSYSMKENNTSNGTTRLAAAKTAMKDFINRIYYDSSNQQYTNSKATVSVITFNTPEPMGDWNKKTKKYDLNIVENSGVNLLGTANKDNYTALVNTINNLSLPSKNPDRDNYSGMGTYIYGGLEKAKETLNNTSSNDKKNVVIFLSDGDPTYLDSFGWNVVDGYEKNSNSNILAMANSIKYNSNNELVTDFYSIGFGSDASNKNSVAYKLLKQMSSDGNVRTSNSVNELVQNFTNILDEIGIKQMETDSGDLSIDISTNLIVSETYPIRVTYDGTEIIRINSKSDLNNYKFVYDESNKKLIWNINAWNESCTAENGRVKVVESHKANIIFYTEREITINNNKMALFTTVIENKEEKSTIPDDVEKNEISITTEVIKNNDENSTKSVNDDKLKNENSDNRVEIDTNKTELNEEKIKSKDSNSLSEEVKELGDNENEVTSVENKKDKNDDKSDKKVNDEENEKQSKKNSDKKAEEEIEKLEDKEVENTIESENKE